MKYIKEVDFAAYSAGRVVRDYPNPYVKDVNGERIEIIPTQEVINMKTLTDEEKEWWCSEKVDEDVVELSMTFLGWFPTELVCGTKPAFVLGSICRDVIDTHSVLNIKYIQRIKTKISSFTSPAPRIIL